MPALSQTRFMSAKSRLRKCQKLLHVELIQRVNRGNLQILSVATAAPVDPLHEEKPKLNNVRQELTDALERADKLFKRPNGSPPHQDAGELRYFLIQHARSQIECALSG